MKNAHLHVQSKSQKVKERFSFVSQGDFNGGGNRLAIFAHKYVQNAFDCMHKLI